MLFRSDLPRNGLGPACCTPRQGKPFLQKRPIKARPGPSERILRGVLPELILLNPEVHEREDTPLVVHNTTKTCTVPTLSTPSHQTLVAALHERQFNGGYRSHRAGCAEARSRTSANVLLLADQKLITTRNLSTPPRMRTTTTTTIILKQNPSPPLFIEDILRMEDAIKRSEKESIGDPVMRDSSNQCRPGIWCT